MIVARVQSHQTRKRLDSPRARANVRDTESPSRPITRVGTRTGSFLDGNHLRNAHSGQGEVTGPASRDCDMHEWLSAIPAPTSSSDAYPSSVPMRRALSIGLAFLIVVGTLAILLPTPPVAARGQIAVYRTGLNWPVALGFASA